MEERTFTITDQNGEKKEAKTLMQVKIEQFHKEYIVYEILEEIEKEKNDDFSSIHIASIQDSEGQTILEPLENEQEWNVIKEMMKQVIERGEEHE